MSVLIPFNKKSDNLNSGGNDLKNLFYDFLNDRWPRRYYYGNTFKLNIQENETEYLVEAELPGIKEEEINVVVTDQKIKISITNDEKTEEERNYIQREIRHSAMSRTIYLDDALAEEIKANLEEGILRLVIYKKEKS